MRLPKERVIIFVIGVPERAISEIVLHVLDQLALFALRHCIVDDRNLKNRRRAKIGVVFVPKAPHDIKCLPFGRLLLRSEEASQILEETVILARQAENAIVKTPFHHGLVSKKVKVDLLEEEDIQVKVEAVLLAKHEAEDVAYPHLSKVEIAVCAHVLEALGHYHRIRVDADKFEIAEGEVALVHVMEDGDRLRTEEEDLVV